MSTQEYNNAKVQFCTYITDNPTIKMHVWSIIFVGMVIATGFLFHNLFQAFYQMYLAFRAARRSSRRPERAKTPQTRESETDIFEVEEPEKIAKTPVKYLSDTNTSSVRVNDQEYTSEYYSSSSDDNSSSDFDTEESKTSISYTFYNYFVYYYMFLMNDSKQSCCKLHDVRERWFTMSNRERLEWGKNHALCHDDRGFVHFSTVVSNKFSKMDVLTDLQRQELVNDWFDYWVYVLSKKERQQWNDEAERGKVRGHALFVQHLNRVKIDMQNLTKSVLTPWQMLDAEEREQWELRASPRWPRELIERKCPTLMILRNLKARNDAPVSMPENIARSAFKLR